MLESYHRIGQSLVQQGVITEEVNQKALEVQLKDPKREFGDILIQDIGVAHHTYFSTLAKLYAFKEWDFDLESIDETVMEFIKRTMDTLPSDLRASALEKKVIPFQLLDKRHEILLVITPNPMDKDVRHIATCFGYRRPEINYARLEAVEHLIDRMLNNEGDILDALQDTNEFTQFTDPEDKEIIDENALDEEINQSMLPRLVEGGLIEAVRRGASDIHIIPSESGSTEFHFRIDGALQLWCTHEGVKAEALSSVVKDRARGVDRFKRDSAQDGFIEREVNGHRIRYRVSVLPLTASSFERKLESIVIRVLDDRKVISDLGALGLQPSAYDAFKEAVNTPQGMVILTGPTGSGKSTTLNAALHSVLNPTRCVLTVEDPVEYIIKGARQIKLGNSLSFEEAVRSILRHDPDIVMVGEMRDLITAQTAIKLANTGHLTFSTLHTNDAISVVSRLYKMGVEPFLIASSINIAVAQRLVRILCPACKIEVEKDKIERALLAKAGMDEEQIDQGTFYQPVGCRACNKIGYKGRTGIHEALSFTKEVRQAILEAGTGVNEMAIREVANSQNMLTLRQSGLARVAAGETSLDEILATTVAA